MNTGFDYKRRVLAYADRISVRPGDTVAFKVSLEDHARFDFKVVRVVNGVETPTGAPYKEVEVETSADGSYPGGFQRIDAGSYAVVPGPPALDRLSSFTFQCYLMPTLPGDGRQVICSRGSGPKRPGFAVILDEKGALALMVGNGETLVTVSTGVAMLPWKWAFVSASYDAQSGEVELWQEPDERYVTIDSFAHVTGKAPTGIGFAADHPLHLAAWQVAHHGDGRPRMAGHFNGRIDSPRLASKVVVCHEMSKLARTIPPRASWVLGAWDLSRDMSGDSIVDVSGNNLHGRLVNLPTRAVTGYHWDGSCHDWTGKPEHYGAIHFHDDDLHDAGWQTSVTLTVPEGLKSGVYAGRFRAGRDEAYVPFYVRPARGAKKAAIAFLGSTATYMAYSNNHWQLDEEKAEVKRGRIIAYTGDELFLNERRDLGLSTYDTHRDGSGVVYASRLRPVVINFNPKSIIWSFNADTHVTDWMEAEGFDFDVVTDEDIHAEGVAALEGYRVIVTGAHPEYWSTPMWDALAAYFDRGGRLMYLGGNGFYWRIGWNGDLTAIEIRRAESGARFWASLPGEYHQSFTGEMGGLWKRIGRPPQSLVGIGTFATGFDRCGWFERAEGSRDPRAAWIFEGVGDGPIGNYGVLGNGAAGIELDGVDHALGSPLDTIVLASSTGHSAYYMQSPDEIVFNHAAVNGDANPRVRADMIYYTLRSGAGMFATGSISWAASLGHNGYDNEVARITGNVLRRFAGEEPLP